MPHRARHKVLSRRMHAAGGARAPARSPPRSPLRRAHSATSPSQVYPLLKPVDKCWQPTDFLPPSEDPYFMDQARWGTGRQGLGGAAGCRARHPPTGTWCSICGTPPWRPLAAAASGVARWQWGAARMAAHPRPLLDFRCR